MNCALSNHERKRGSRCRSWTCNPCFEFNLSTNDKNLIRSQMIEMKERELSAIRKDMEELISELTSIQAQLQTAIGERDEVGRVLYWYADRDNWVADQLMDLGDMDESFDNGLGRADWAAGKRAREVLARFPNRKVETREIV